MISSGIIDDFHLLIRAAGFPDVRHFGFCMEDEISRERLNNLPATLFLYMISNNDHNHDPALIMHKLVVVDGAPVHTMPMRGSLGIIRGGLNPRSLPPGG